MNIPKVSNLIMVCCFSLVFLFVSISRVCAIDLSGEEREYLRTKGTIVFVSQTRYPPFEYTDADRQHEGMMIDFARWMAVEMGFKPVFMNMTFQQAQEAVLSGKADIITSLFYSDKRKEKFEFTEALFDVAASIFVRAERTDIKDIKDLNGKTIAIQRGDYAKDFLESQKIRFDTLNTNDFAEATEMVIAGNADAVIGDEQIVFYHLFSNRLTDYTKKVGEPLYTGKNCMASNKRNAVLIGILNKGIHEAQKSGVLDKISTKWLGTKYGPRKSFLERYLWPLSAAAGGILLLSLWAWIWNIRLHTLVRKKTEVITRREEALQESELWMKGIFNALDESVLVVTPDRRLININHAAQKIFGYSHEEFFNQSTEILHVDHEHYLEFGRRIQDAFDKGETANFEFDARRKNGEIFPTEHSVSILKSEKGEPKGIVSVVRDITERRQAEERLRESEAKFRILFESADDAIVVMDQDIIIDCNPKLLEILNCTREQIIGQTPALFSPEVQPDGRNSLEKMREKHAAALSGQTQFFEWKFYRFDGSLHDAEVSLNPFITADKCYIQAIVHNITDRKRMEEALQEAKDYAENLIQSANVLVVGLDNGGNVTLLNEAGEQMTGYKADEVVGKNWFELIVPKDRYPYVWDEFNKLKKAGTIIDTFENPINTKSGEELIISWKNSTLRHDGKVVGTISFGMDITSRKKDEAELLRAHKLESLGVLAGGIAHDFNNLMAIVQGYIDLAIMDLPPDHVSRKRLLTAMRSVEQTKDLTSRLITFSRGGDPVREIFDLTEIIRDAVHRTVKGTEVRVKFAFVEDLWLAEVDELQMKQCFCNLTQNALEAMPQGGELAIQAENALVTAGDVPDLREGSYLKVTFADEGIGIPEEHLLKVFDPYFTTKGMGAQKGLGLGLAVCYSVLKKHGGHITVSSQLGKGASFVLYLPAQANPAKEKDVKKRLSTGAVRVLIMDDESHIRMIMRAYLERLGCKVTDVEDGQEAIDTYKLALHSNNPFELVILDLTVRQGLGGQLAMERLLKIDPGIRAIIASGYIDDPVIKNFADYGFRGALKKPFKGKEMKSLVEKILHG